MFFGDGKIYPVAADSVITDNAIDIGDPTLRFKDLHLSGGVVFGDAGGSGTSLSNTLDSYEEGTWTPTCAVGTISVNYARYTKVGGLVTIIISNIKFSDFTSASAINIGGLPFTNNVAAAVGSVMISRKDTTESVTAYINTSSTSISFYANATASFSSLRHNELNNSDNGFFITVTYIA